MATEKKSNKRIYIVSEDGKVKHMVRASSQAQAINAIAIPRFTAEVASTGDVLAMAEAGCKVIEAGDD